MDQPELTRLDVTTLEPYPKLWWVASYPKSGNTWLRALLTAYLTGECHINHLLGYQDTDAYANHVVSPGPVGLREEYLLRPAALLHLWRMYELTGPMLVKTHNAFGSVDGVPLVPMCYRAVYIVRDPRDVAMSLARHMGYQPEDAVRDMANTAHRLESNGCHQVVSSWSGNVSTWLDSDAYVVRYEDLKARPAQEFAAVWEHMAGEPADMERVRDAVERTSLDRLRAQESESGFVGRGEQARFFGGSEPCPPDIARRIVEDHAEVMRQAGYDTPEEAAA